MAAEEFSQGAALGPDFSEPTGGGPPAKPDIPDLHAVLGEFMVALCVVEMVYRALDGLMEQASADVGPCAIALRHGFEMLDAVYTRFDEGLLGYRAPDDDEPDELGHEPEQGAEDGDDDADDDARHDEHERGRTLGKHKRLALVA